MTRAKWMTDEQWKETRLKISRRYYKNNKEKIKEMNKRYEKSPQGKTMRKGCWLKFSKQKRYSALYMIGHGDIKCVNCGCDDMRILEINHINGGGSKERGKESSLRLMIDVIRGTRSINDLEIRCKVCNILHYVNLKYGISNITVHFDPLTQRCVPDQPPPK